jgi:hypothetical protein
MHITNEGQEGPVPREFCILPTLREFDFNGAHYSGKLLPVHSTGATAHEPMSVYFLVITT